MFYLCLTKLKIIFILNFRKIWRNLMDFTKQMLNEILVKLFNVVLFSEEEFLKRKMEEKITLKSVHVLEAIKQIETDEKNASMSQIKDALGVTAGTLSVVLKKLEDKGYVVKKKAKEDKRKFYITLTKKAEKVINVHKEYHESMIDMITRNLSKKEEEGLVDLLSKIKYFFS